MYYPNLTGSGSPLHTYGYTYDWSGNRLTETLDSVTRSFGYNSANQLVSDGSTANANDSTVPLPSSDTTSSPGSISPSGEFPEGVGTRGKGTAVAAAPGWRILLASVASRPA